jgi:N-acetylmuramoyl-L-alanine amidase
MPDQRERPRRDLWREASSRRREQRHQHPATPHRPRAFRPADRPAPRDARSELRESLLPGLSDLIDPTNRLAGDAREREFTATSRHGLDPDASDQLTRPLTDDERRSFLRRYRELPPRSELDDPDDDYDGYPLHGEPQESLGSDRMSSRTVTLGAILVIGILAVSLGAGGVFGNRGAVAPDPTPTVQSVVVALGSPTAAVALTSEESTPANSTIEDPEWPGQGDGRMVVCIDPGHGGLDQGFSRPLFGILPGLTEADYNLAHAYDLAERLEEDGFEVVMTRRTLSAVNADGADVNGDGETIADSQSAGTIDELQARINICNDADADLLVSMHINGSEARPLVKGYETWYTGSRPFGDHSQRFATLVFRALGSQMEAAGYITDPREVNDDRNISVDESNPSLLDHMIMTGPDVRGVIDGTEIHDAIVSAYESAILDYFDETQS